MQTVIASWDRTRSEEQTVGAIELCAWCGEPATGLKLVEHGQVARGKGVVIRDNRTVPACTRHLALEELSPPEEKRRSESAKAGARKKKWDRLW